MHVRAHPCASSHVCASLCPPGADCASAQRVERSFRSAGGISRPADAWPRAPRFRRNPGGVPRPCPLAAGSLGLLTETETAGLVDGWIGWVHDAPPPAPHCFGPPTFLTPKAGAVRRAVRRLVARAPLRSVWTNSCHAATRVAVRTTMRTYSYSITTTDTDNGKWTGQNAQLATSGLTRTDGSIRRHPAHRNASPTRGSGSDSRATGHDLVPPRSRSRESEARAFR